MSSDMEGDQAERLEEAVALAFDLRDEGVEDWLERAAGDDQNIRRAIEQAVSGTESLVQALQHSSTHDPGLQSALGTRFALRRPAGAGAMGVVYQARDTELERDVAVKVVRVGLTPRAEAGRRFEREAEAAAAVRHPSIVTLHDKGTTEEGDPFLVMEWLEGVSLADLVAGAPTGTEADGVAWLRAAFGIDTGLETNYLRAACRWMLGVARGLAEVHAAGVIHRDVKPSNVMLTREGRAVLLDFGVAQLADGRAMTREGCTVGTPAYLSPEVLVRGASHSVASDVYGLGATLYFLVTRATPYGGAPHEVVARMVSQDPRPAVELRPGLSRDLRAILDCAMERRPGARYPSAAAFADDLAALLAHEEVAARPIGRWRRIARRVGRSRTFRGAAAALAVAVFVLGGVVLVEHRRTERLHEHRELLRHLQPGPTTVGADNRTWRFDADRLELENRLGRMIELAVEPERALLLRSSLRLDHGDTAGAASDARRLADLAGTSFAQGLAESYARLAPGDVGHDALVLDGLPEPELAVDRYLAGYHLVRAGEHAAAYEVLDAPETLQRPHARELHLTFTPLGGLTQKELEARAWGVVDGLVELEDDLGGPTATTRHLMSAYLFVLDRFERSFACAEESVGLAPRAHTNRINAAQAALSLGRPSRAHGHLDVAEELVPGYWRPLMLRSWGYVDEGRFEECMEHIDRASLDGPWAEYLKEYRRADVASMAAIDARSRGDEAGAERWVARGAPALDAARALADVSEDDPSIAMLIELRRGRDESIPARLMELAAQTPGDGWRLRRVLDHLPAELDTDETAALAGLLEALAIAAMTAPDAASDRGGAR